MTRWKREIGLCAVRHSGKSLETTSRMGGEKESGPLRLDVTLMRRPLSDCSARRVLERFI